MNVKGDVPRYALCKHGCQLPSYSSLLSLPSFSPSLPYFPFPPPSFRHLRSICLRPSPCTARHYTLHPPSFSSPSSSFTLLFFILFLYPPSSSLSSSFTLLFLLLLLQFFHSYPSLQHQSILSLFISCAHTSAHQSPTCHFSHAIHPNERLPLNFPFIHLIFRSSFNFIIVRPLHHLFL